MVLTVALNALIAPMYVDISIQQWKWNLHTKTKWFINPYIIVIIQANRMDFYSTFYVDWRFRQREIPRPKAISETNLHFIFFILLQNTHPVLDLLFPIFSVAILHKSNYDWWMFVLSKISQCRHRMRVLQKNKKIKCKFVSEIALLGISRLCHKTKKITKCDVVVEQSNVSCRNRLTGNGELSFWSPSNL